MLYTLEVFVYLALAIFIATQMIVPALRGEALFPLFHTRKREKELEVVKRLREDIDLQQAIDEIIKDLDDVERFSDAERDAAVKRLTTNTERISAKIMADEAARVEAAKGGN